MKLQIPLSTTAHTPPLTTEEGSQSVESFYKTQINHYNHKHITTFYNNNKNNNNQMYYSLQRRQLLSPMVYARESKFATIENSNRTSYKIFKPKPTFNSILTNNFLRARALIKKESIIPVTNRYLGLPNVNYNTQEKKTLYNKKELMNYFLTKTCSNFNNKYNCGVRHSSLKRRKELQKFFTEIRNETIDSSKSEYKKKRFIKIKDKEIQGIDVNKYNIDKDNVYSKIRSLSNKQVSIKLMKMLQQKA
jgi:hypothetical protein